MALTLAGGGLLVAVPGDGLVGPSTAAAQASAQASAQADITQAAPCRLGPVRAVERELAADVVRDSVGSLSAAVVLGDEVVWRAAFGWRDRDARTLASPATLYRAGSLSKTVTALLLLRLVDSGVVSLDDPVAAALPEIRGLSGAVRDAGAVQDSGLVGRSAEMTEAVTPEVAGAITYRHLATHTAGLAREPERAVFGRGSFREWKWKVVAAIPHTRLLDSPGSAYRYSNIGYGLLGFALERAAGRPFEVLVDSLVFRPLGMDASRLQLDDYDRRRLATGYVNPAPDTADPRVPRAERPGRGYRVPSGGLFSTAGDLARLGMALTGAIPLLPDSLRQLMITRSGMQTLGATAAPPADTGLVDPDPDDLADPERGAGYGIGVHLLTLGAAALVGHSGTVPGYTAFLLVDPATGAGVVLLRSYNQGETNLGAAATRLLLEMCETPPGTFPDGASALRPRALFRSPAGPAGARSRQTGTSPRRWRP